MMSILESRTEGKACFLFELSSKLSRFVERSARDGTALAEVERTILESVLAMSHACVEQFIALKGVGDSRYS